MENKMLSECDQCKQEFEIKLQERKHLKQTTEHYLVCPYCEVEYIAYVTDPHVIKEQKELRELNERYLNKKNKLSQYMQRKKAEVQKRKDDEQSI